MTKKEMNIILERENELSKQLEVYEERFGIHSDIACLKRAEWNGVYELRKILEKSDR